MNCMRKVQHRGGIMVLQTSEAVQCSSEEAERLDENRGSCPDSRGRGLLPGGN
jgi:hypothetical protein